MKTMIWLQSKIDVTWTDSVEEAWQEMEIDAEHDVLKESMQNLQNHERWTAIYQE